MTKDECRSRRVALGWTIDQLATRSGVVEATVRNFEAGLSAPREGTLIALRKTLRAAEREATPAATVSA